MAQTHQVRRLRQTALWVSLRRGNLSEVVRMIGTSGLRPWLGYFAQIDIREVRDMRRSPFGMARVRSFGVRSMSRGRIQRCEILRSPHSSASLVEPRILCYGSTPCPKVRFPEGHHIKNNADDMNAFTHIIVPRLQGNRTGIEFAFVLRAQYKPILSNKRGSTYMDDHLLPGLTHDNTCLTP